MEYVSAVAIVLLLVLAVVLIRMPKAESGDYPYTAEKLLTSMEMSFFLVLQSAVADRWYICPKVRMADLMTVTTREKGFLDYFRKIQAKHADFVLMDSQANPVLVIELDDSSHSNKRAQANDFFKDQAYRHAGIPICRNRARAQWDAAEIRAVIEGSVLRLGA